MLVGQEGGGCAVCLGIILRKGGGCSVDMQTRQGRGCVAPHSVGIVLCRHWLNNQLSSIPYFCGRKSIIKVDRYMLLLLLPYCHP